MKKIKNDDALPYWLFIVAGGGMWATTPGTIPTTTVIGMLLMCYGGMSLAYLKGGAKK